jgi:prophage maintenance system killer protein
LTYGEDDVTALAVRLLAGFCQSHAFEQGNKRTSSVAMVQFLRMNGYELAIDDTEGWAEKVIALVEYRSTEGDFVRVIRQFVIAI